MAKNIKFEHILRNSFNSLSKYLHDADRNDCLENVLSFPKSVDTISRFFFSDISILLREDINTKVSDTCGKTGKDPFCRSEINSEFRLFRLLSGKDRPITKNRLRPLQSLFDPFSGTETAGWLVKILVFKNRLF